MPNICISRYFVLGEMTHQKMMAVKLMCAMNKRILALAMKAVAQGALERELSNLHVARYLHDSAAGKSKLFCFLSAFNKMNGYSNVAHSVGMHCNRFRDKEFVENKIMFAMRRHSGHKTLKRGESATRE